MGDFVSSCYCLIQGKAAVFTAAPGSNVAYGFNRVLSPFTKRALYFSPVYKPGHWSGPSTGAAAARQAGYSPKSARFTAHRLKRHAVIREALAELREITSSSQAVQDYLSGKSFEIGLIRSDWPYLSIRELKRKRKKRTKKHDKSQHFLDRNRDHGIASLVSKVRTVGHTMHLTRTPLQRARKGSRMQCRSNINTGGCASSVS